MQSTIPSCLITVLSDHPLTLADAGAAGGIHQRWLRLGGYLKVLGFEPDQREFDLLAERSDRVWINAALGERETEISLLVTRHQTNTSLLLPNRPIVDRIYQNPSDFDVMKTVAVPCTTLDAASRTAQLEIAALKADTQGTELAILRGARRCLQATLLVVELEVEFTPLYREQPLFSDVDEFMREHGFMLVDLGNLLCHKWRNSASLGGRKGQLLAADALYFRDPESFRNILTSSAEPLRLLAHYWALCAVYGYLDLAYEVTLGQQNSAWMPSTIFAEISAWAEMNARKGKGFEIRGRGRTAAWLRKLADKVDPPHHSHWINPLGNE